MEEWKLTAYVLRDDRDWVKFFGHVSRRFLRRAILVGLVWQANWVPTVTPGRPVKREGVWLGCASCWPPRPRRRLSCVRRTGISKHPIVLSVFRSRVRHLFFPEHLSRRSFGSFRRRWEATRCRVVDNIWIAKISPYVDERRIERSQETPANPNGDV